MKQVTINVSRHNIRHGDPTKGDNCIVQRAIRDAIPLADVVGVGLVDYGMKHINGRIKYDVLPNRVQWFIARTLLFKSWPPYLRWLVLYPFSFELEVPDCFVAVEPTRPLQSSCAGPDNRDMVSIHSDQDALSVR